MALLARGGRIVYWAGHGHRDLSRTVPLEPDAIFRIQSMTKPIATVAVLMLEEEGRLRLSDPVGRHLREFSGRAVTLHHLLTHTSGLALADDSVESAHDLAGYARAASRKPQAAPAGSRFEYASVNTELAARVVEVASGVPFERFVRERILEPLGMRDTFFSVPESQRHRIAQMTTTTVDGRLVPQRAGDGRIPGDAMRRWTSGAGGLYSTAGDYVRFCQALLDGGALEGKRILSAATVDRMMSNQLGHLSPPVSQYQEGFGLGGFVKLEHPASERPGSVGAWGWSGAGGTYFMIDRRERLVAILLTQHTSVGSRLDPPKPSFRFYNLAYQALSPRASPN